MIKKNTLYLYFYYRSTKFKRIFYSFQEKSLLSKMQKIWFITFFIFRLLKTKDFFPKLTHLIFVSAKHPFKYGIALYCNNRHGYFETN